MLNIKIRKQFFIKDIPIAYCGTFFDFNFPIFHLGISIQNLFLITEGKHLICQKIRAAIKPLILLGSEIGLRIDCLSLQNVFRYLSKKIFLNLNNFIGLNIMHTNLTQTNVCELGIT